MKRKNLAHAVCVIGLCAALSVLGKENVSASSENPVTDVSLIPKTDGSMEYAMIIATDDDGAPVWTMKTDEYEAAQLSAFADIGIFQDQYYYVERGKVIALDLSSGQEKWENSDFGGSPTQYCHIIMDNGTVLLSGYFGPDFYAIDKNGNTVGRIDTINPDYYWPFSMGLSGEDLMIRMEGSPNGEEADVFVNLSDSLISGTPSQTEGNTMSGTGKSADGYANEELVEMAREYYRMVNGQRPPIVEVDSINGDEVTIHLYQQMSDHTATWDWYYVDRRTLKGYDLLGNEIDFNMLASAEMGHEVYLLESEDDYEDYIILFFEKDTGNLKGFTLQTKFDKSCGHTKEELMQYDLDVLYPGFSSYSFAESSITEKGRYVDFIVKFKDLDNMDHVRQLDDNGILTLENRNAESVSVDSIMQLLEEQGAKKMDYIEYGVMNLDTDLD